MNQNHESRLLNPDWSIQIPRAPAVCKEIANEARSADWLAIIISYPTSEWNNCFIKNHQQILLDFADFT